MVNLNNVAGVMVILFLFVGACTPANNNPVTITDNDQAAESLVASTDTPKPIFTATPLPTSTSTATTTPSPSPSATVSPTPTPTATPKPALQQLTRNGCCVQPFFSSDNQQVLFIDKPSPAAPTGIYGVNVDGSSISPTLVSDRVGFRSPDRTIVATIEGDNVNLINEDTGESWLVDTSGNWPRFSPNGQQILWTATDREGPYDRRQSDIWLVNLDGRNPELQLSVVGGGFAGWLPDSQNILIVTRDNPAEEARTLSVYNLESGQRSHLVTERRIRGIEISPEGSWIAYFLTFAQEPANNGIWVISSDGQTRRKLDPPGFGAYHWQNDNTLLFIPIRTSVQDSMQLWAIDVLTQQNQLLVDPNSLKFSISNGDWDVSPNGQHVVFVSSADQNIWQIQLP